MKLAICVRQAEIISIMLQYVVVKECYHIWEQSIPDFLGLESYLCTVHHAPH